jgi:predicted  nucleic acid-binding Zn-ribbon protein
MKPPSFRWFSPFKLGDELLQQLANRGAIEWDGNDSSLNGGEVLLIYFAPHQLVMRGDDAAEGYKRLKRLAQRGTLWRHDRLLSWLTKEHPSLPRQANREDVGMEITQPSGDEAIPENNVSALSALFTLRYFEEEPSALDCYLDLELRSKIENDEPDLQYAFSLHRLASFESARDSHLDLCSENKIILANCNALNEENKKLSESVRQLKDDLSEKESSLISAQGASLTEIHQLHTEIERILSFQSDLSHQIDSLSAELDRERLSTGTLEETLASERINHQDKASVLESEVSRLREVEQTLSTTLNDILASHSELSQQVTLLNLELDNERAKASSLQETLDSERTKHRDEASYLESEIIRLREVEETLNTTLNNILASQSELSQQVTLLKMEHDSERSKVTFLQDELASERDRYRLEVEALGIENEHLQAEVIRLAESADPLLQQEPHALGVSSEHIEKLHEAYIKIDEVLSKTQHTESANTKADIATDTQTTLNKSVSPATGHISVVEVAPITTEESLGIEVQALLASYRSSLKLAYELLEASRLHGKEHK